VFPCQNISKSTASPQTSFQPSKHLAEFKEKAPEKNGEGENKERKWEGSEKKG